MSPRSYRHRIRGSRGDTARSSAQKMREERGAREKKNREAAKHTYMFIQRHTELCRCVSRNIMQSFDRVAERRYFLVPRSRVRMLVGVDLFPRSRADSFLMFLSNQRLRTPINRRKVKLDTKLISIVALETSD